MHILAYFYHWDRDTIFNVPVTERKEWVEMVRKQIKAENGSSKEKENSTSTYAES